MNELEKLFKEELIDIINKFIALSDENALFVKTLISADNAIDVAAYKQMIAESLEFNPFMDIKFNFDKVFYLLDSFELATDNLKLLADVFVYAVVKGQKITDEFGDIDQEYYECMINLFDRACQMVVLAHELDHDVSSFKKLLYKVLLKARNIGWGYSDETGYLWKNYFEGKDE